MKALYVKKINHIPLLVGSIFVFILAIVFLVLSFNLFTEDIPENYVEVEATIDKIDELLIENEYQYDVYISYTYDEVEYKEVKYDKFDSSMKEGNKVNIYVDPLSPNVYMSDTKDNFIFLVLCGVFAVAGLVGIIYNIKMLKTNKRSDD